jgi:hypothetical protein
VLLSETAKANSSSCSNPNCMIVAIRHRSLLEAFALFIIAYLTDTVVRNFRYQRSNSHPQGAHSGCDPDCGVRAVPACGLASRARALRASCPPALRPVRGVYPLDWDRRKAGNAAAGRVPGNVSQATWPEVEKPRPRNFGQSRGGAPRGERARSGRSEQTGGP